VRKRTTAVLRQERAEFERILSLPQTKPGYRQRLRKAIAIRTQAIAKLESQPRDR
jgi:hypothetical protein